MFECAQGIDLVPALLRELEATIRRRCRESGAQVVDFCVDLGTPKSRPEDSPALSYFRAGKADALLIACVPSDQPLPRGDLLTSRALSGFPGGWLDAEGYAAPNTEPGHWTRKDVLKLLREGRSLQPILLPDEPLGAPAALL